METVHTILNNAVTITAPPLTAVVDFLIAMKEMFVTLILVSILLIQIVLLPINSITQTQMH